MKYSKINFIYAGCLLFIGIVFYVLMLLQGGVKSDNAHVVLILSSSISLLILLIPFAFYLIRLLFQIMTTKFSELTVSLFIVYVSWVFIINQFFEMSLSNAFILSVLASPIALATVYSIIYLFRTVSRASPPPRTFESSLDPEYSRLYDLNPGSQLTVDAVEEFHRKKVISNLKSLIDCCHTNFFR